MSDNRPPVVVEFNASWPEQGDYLDGTFEIARDEWEQMTPEQRSERCEQITADRAAGVLGWGWNIADPDDFASTEEPG